MIFAIDPGNEESAYVLVEDDLSKVIDKGKVSNEELMEIIYRVFYMEVRHSNIEPKIKHVAIEMVASFGMSVGKSVFDTCVWIGRFYQAIYEQANVEPVFIYRMDEKMCLCHDSRAKDSNIRQALIDRFGVVGTKKNPGYFYGFKKDIWSAMAVATAYHDKYIGDVK